MIYPNPTTNLVIITGLKGKSNISVSDSSGKVLLSENYNDNEVELNFGILASGTYYIKVIGNYENRNFRVLKK